MAKTNSVISTEIQTIYNETVSNTNIASRIGGTLLDMLDFTDLLSTSGKTFKEYVYAIKEVAAYYSFYVLDTYSESGLNPMMEIGSVNRYYFIDGLHPNTIGVLRLAKYMQPKLEDIYKSFIN